MDRANRLRVLKSHINSYIDGWTHAASDDIPQYLLSFERYKMILESINETMLMDGDDEDLDIAEMIDVTLPRLIRIARQRVSEPPSSPLQSH